MLLTLRHFDRSTQSSATECFAERCNSSYPIQACISILLSVYNISLSEVSQRALILSQLSHNFVRNVDVKSP